MLSLTRAWRLTEYLSGTEQGAEEALAQKVSKTPHLSVCFAIVHKGHCDLISLWNVTEDEEEPPVTPRTPDCLLVKELLCQIEEGEKHRVPVFLARTGSG